MASASTGCREDHGPRTTDHGLGAHVAIACGGTGGHLFPGLAVAEALVQRGCEVTLLVSPKDVDQQALGGARGEGRGTSSGEPGVAARDTRHATRDTRHSSVVTLPAVAMQGRQWLPFARGFWNSWQVAKKAFKAHPPDAVLAMGGFTSAPSILAANAVNAATFLHEANTIPGRANRWLAPWVDEVFVGFASAAPRLRNQSVRVTGMPVRSEFQPADAVACRMSLGLAPELAVLLVTGGSQGASGVNQAMLRIADRLAPFAGRAQVLHLSGPHDGDALREAYRARGLRAKVVPFLSEMELALGAATVAISRAGASSLAELAAMRVPAILVPYPTAADNHQLSNARAFLGTGAARLWEQSDDPGGLAALVIELLENAVERIRRQQALAEWHAPQAAEEIALSILKRVRAARSLSSPAQSSILGSRPSPLVLSDHEPA